MARQKMRIETPDFSNATTLQAKESFCRVLFPQGIERRGGRDTPEDQVLAASYRDVVSKVKDQFRLSQVPYQQVINYMANHLDEMQEILARPRNIDGVDYEVAPESARPEFVSFDEDDDDAPPVPKRAPRNKTPRVSPRPRRPRSEESPIQVTEDDLYDGPGGGSGDEYEDPEAFRQTSAAARAWQDKREAAARENKDDELPPIPVGSEHEGGGVEDRAAAAEYDEMPGDPYQYATPAAPPPDYAEATPVAPQGASGSAVPQPNPPAVIPHSQWKKVIKRMATSKGNLSRLEGLMAPHANVVFVHPNPTSKAARKDFERLASQLAKLDNQKARNLMRSVQYAVREQDDNSLAAGLIKRANNQKPTFYHASTPTMPAKNGPVSGSSDYAALNAEGAYGSAPVSPKADYEALDESTRAGAPAHPRSRAVPDGYDAPEGIPAGGGGAEPYADIDDEEGHYASATGVGDLSIAVDLKGVSNSEQAQQIAAAIAKFSNEQGEPEVGVHFNADNREGAAVQFVDQLVQYHLDHANDSADDDEEAFADFYNAVTGGCEQFDDFMDDFHRGESSRADIRAELVNAISKPAPSDPGSIMHCVKDGGEFVVTTERAGQVERQHNAPVPDGQHPRHTHGKDDTPEVE